MSGIRLDSPIVTVLGSGAKDRKKTQALADKLGVRTVGDLLWRFPRTYLKTGELTDAGSLSEGQPIVVVAEVTDSEVRRFTNRRTGRPGWRLVMTIRTVTDALTLTMFAPREHMATYWSRQWRPGTMGVFTGKVSRFRNTWQLTHPQMVKITDGAGDDEESALHLAESIGELFPVYRTTAGVESWDIARVVNFALTVVDEIDDPLSETLREAHDLPDLPTALRWLHAPDDWSQVERARRRFRFEEALATQVVLARRRAFNRVLGATPRRGGGGLREAFDARLPFTLTGGQREIGAVLDEELAADHPMNRLLQGEVGSGKTLVALRAMLRVVDSGGQAVLLAPTEVLAQQHHRSIRALMGDLAEGGRLGSAEHATDVVLLTGSLGRAQRKEALLAMASGEAGIVVGTHALLEEQVQFADLGFVVVDEQHRFGVEQRSGLAAKAGHPPHLLVMTATPIPRTVAMTVFGDLEVSTLSELPAGRAAIQTSVVPLRERPDWIHRVWSRVREEVQKGHQAYVVVPRIGGDEAEEGQVDQPDLDEDGEEIPDMQQAELAAVETVLPELVEGPLAGTRVAALHGRLAADEKEQVMRAFADGQIDVLVATTVIEVGVDVANATVMVLLDADRFGVSQLHQLRGRVGRGGLPGLCLLVTRAERGSAARQRLAAVESSVDGFELSRVDLAQRREGDVLGAGQSGGRTSLVHLRVLRDEDTILEARAAAEELLATDPALDREPHLREAVRALETSEQSQFLERS